MIEHELLLLGLLRQGPKHGYEIKTKVKQILSFFAGVEVKSIYYPLKVLKEKGFIDRRITKVGKRPKRIVYSLTYKGRKRFEALLGRSILELKRPQFSLDLSLYFLNYLKPASARKRLFARLKMLQKITLNMKRMPQVKEAKGYSSLSKILEHNIQMLKTEEKFLFKLIKSIPV